jgi:hypothetical protein
MRNWNYSGTLIGFLGLLVAALFVINAQVEAATLTWDAGNTTNGATIDPGSGT